MVSSSTIRHAAWLLAMALLASPAAIAHPGEPASDKRKDKKTHDARTEQARIANARSLRTPRSERAVALTTWKPVDATLFMPSGEYLTVDELVQREDQRQHQGKQLLSTTIEIRSGVHEAR